MYTVLAILIALFLTVFIGFNLLTLFKKIKSEYGYTLVVPLLGFFGWLVITVIYIDLYSGGLSFVDGYKFEINNQKAITIGSGEEDGKNTYLTNRLAVSSHLSLRFDVNDSDYIGTLELLTDKRKAIVNDLILKNISETENGIRESLEIGKKEVDGVNEIKVSNGDFVRIGYSNYKIYREADTIILDNVSLNLWSPTNMFYLYTTTTYPDLVIGDKHGVESTGIFWLWFITTVVMALFTYLIFYIILKIFSYSARDKDVEGIHPIVHPILYFSVFLEFLLVASFINFTIMYFYQFNHYEKGSLFTELFVFLLMYAFGYITYQLIYKRKIASIKVIGGYIALLLFFILFWRDDIYSSITYLTIPKDMIIFFGEQVFIFAIFILFANFLSKEKSYIFGLSTHTSDDIYNVFLYGSIILVLLTTILGSLHIIQEGQGMVFIESAKVFTLLLLSMLLRGSVSKSSIGDLAVISFFVIGLLASIFMIKDKGSVLQIVLVLGILYVLFKDGFSLDIKSRFFKIALPILVFSLIILVGYGFYFFVLQNNIRFAMWIEPFEQSIEPSTQYFMYRYEQLARGLFLIKSGGFFPSDFVNSDFLPLPAIHTDFIFAFYTNIFGYGGVIALILALIMISQSIVGSTGLYSKRDEIFKFLYAINSIFIAYMLSYYIINISSVLQIIPLTDVPLPFLTYSKGILVFFFMLYLFVVAFNIKYLQHLKGE